MVKVSGGLIFHLHLAMASIPKSPSVFHGWVYSVGRCMNIGQADWPLGKGQFLHWAVVNRHRTAKAPIKQRERSCPRFQGLWILCCIFQFSSLEISFSHFLSLHALELFDFPCTQCKVCTTEHCQTFSGHASFKPWSVLKMGGKLQKKLCLFLGFHWT